MIKKTNILISHDNRTPGHTSKVHKFAEKIQKNPKYNVIVDKSYWKPGERTSKTETNRREIKMVRRASTIVRVVPSPSKTGLKRKEGAEREIRKGVYRGKKIIEIYENGGRRNPKTPISIKNYKKKVQVNLKPKQRLMTGFKQGMKKLMTKPEVGRSNSSKRRK